MKKVQFHFCLIINKLMIDFGLCWDFKVRSHRCTNEIQQEQEILLKNSESGKKLGPIVGS